MMPRTVIIKLSTRHLTKYTISFTNHHVIQIIRVNHKYTNSKFSVNFYVLNNELSTYQSGQFYWFSIGMKRQQIMYYLSYSNAFKQIGGGTVGRLLRFHISFFLLKRIHMCHVSKNVCFFPFKGTYPFKVR